jgi:hypothetical protein
MSHCQKKIAATYTMVWTTGFVWYARASQSMPQPTTPTSSAHLRPTTYGRYV